MTVSFDLSGKNILVTGAGRGLGQQIADDLADHGARVFGTSRDAETSNAIAKRYGTAPLTYEARQLDQLDSFVERLFGEVGTLDALVNNAGVNIPKPSVDVSPDDWSTMIETNAAAPFFLSTAIGRQWLRRGEQGSIVNVASQAGIVAIEERAPYGASKAALIHVTKVLAVEWAPHNIRVNGVAPTFVRTEMTESTFARKDWADELLSRIPMGRLAEPDDVTGAVIFLLSDAARFITGQTLLVDGGYTLR